MFLPGGKNTADGDVRCTIRESTVYYECCSFCNKSKDEIKRLTAGMEISICDECVDNLSKAMRDNTAPEGSHLIILVTGTCSFCGFVHEDAIEVKIGASTTQASVICGKCLDLCIETAQEEEETK